MRKWSDRIEIPAGTRECPVWLKGAEAGEWRDCSDYYSDPYVPTQAPDYGGYHFGGSGVNCASRLLDDGWSPASEMPSDEECVDIRFQDGDEKIGATADGCWVNVLCWRPHVAQSEAPQADAEKKPAEKPKRPMTEFDAFEDWISRECPSGDCESVQYQWTRSSAYRKWCESQDPTPDEVEEVRTAVDSLAAMQNRDLEGAEAQRQRSEAERDRQSYAFFAQRGAVDRRLLTIAPLGALCGAKRWGGEE